MKTISNGRRTKKKLKIENTVSLLTYEGGIRGKLRGNFECGSAQPSLFSFTLVWTQFLL
jgi:hypothetical protein